MPTTCGPKQGIGGGTVVVFAGALGHEDVGHVAVLGQQVAGGRGQVQGAGLQHFAVGGPAAGQGGVPGQPVYQVLAVGVGSEVLHH
nr:hypothetical protein [Hymenobacter terricola]